MALLYAEVGCGGLMKKSALPDAFNTVTVKDSIDADDRYSEFQRLRRKQPVKWIAMVQRQQAGADGVKRINLNGDEFLLLNHFQKVRHQGMQRNLSLLSFDRKLPRNDRRDQNIVGQVFDEMSAFKAEP